MKALGIDVDGAFAEYIVSPAYNIHKIGDINFDEATFIEPLAAAINTFELSPLRKEHENIVIIGAGKLGLLILQVAKISGRKTIVIGRSHLNYAKKLGVDIVIHSEEDYKKKIKKNNK
ncbi:MAG: hypothetical protein GF329_16570 [Candidatus Lokiarchaeota archaeon]|nr:hypothetical protein [Candidatus Lokiarchaeota archaeon]